MILNSHEKKLTVIYTLTIYLTPWSTVLLGKLVDPQEVKKFPIFDGT
jgi:hypothetical protein